MTWSTASVLIVDVVGLSAKISTYVVGVRAVSEFARVNVCAHRRTPPVTLPSADDEASDLRCDDRFGVSMKHDHGAPPAGHA